MDEQTDAVPLLIFCGGTGMHWFMEYLGHIHSSVSLPSSTRRLVKFIVPVTDDGGSSRTIINSIGGPAVGDVRNVVLALAAKCDPTETKDDVKTSLHQLLRRRLCWSSSEDALADLSAWTIGLPDSCRNAVRTFLSIVSAEAFDFRGASLGNVVLTGMMLQHRASEQVECFMALHAASHELCSVLGIPDWIEVVPSCATLQYAMTTNGAPLPQVRLSALLDNDEVVEGQTMISYGVDGEVKKHQTGAVPLRAVQSLRVDVLCGNTSRTPYCRSGVGMDRAHIMLGCGSFITSTLASAVMWTTPTVVTGVTLLLNAECDRETQFAFVGSTTQSSNCRCALQLRCNPVVKLASSARRCVEWLPGLTAVAYGQGSVFEAPAVALSKAMECDDRCEDCRSALEDAGVLPHTVIVELAANNGFFAPIEASSKLWSIL